MFNHKHFWIGGLALSAVVLFSTLVLLDRSVRAEGGVLDKGGDYTMVTGPLAGAGDAVYIIDSPSDKINMYRLTPGTNKLALVQSRELKVPQPPARK